MGGVVSVLNTSGGVLVPAPLHTTGCVAGQYGVRCPPHTPAPSPSHRHPRWSRPGRTGPPSVNLTHSPFGETLTTLEDLEVGGDVGRTAVVMRARRFDVRHGLERYANGTLNTASEAL